MESVTGILGTAAVLLGVVFGSFLNALLFRFNTGKSVMRGRSKCMICSHPLGFFDLVPVFSFLFLVGKCRYCGARIDWQYPLVEIMAGILAFLVFIQTGVSLAFFFWLFVWLAFLFVVVYDLRHGIIPWSASILLMVCSFISLFISFDGSTILFHLPTLLALAAGPLCALPLFLLSLVSGGRWMGWGDSGLELSIGWMLGLAGGVSALFIAFWSGALVGIVLLGLANMPRLSPAAKGVTMKSEIPFAPFLILGCAAVYFFHVAIFSNIFW
jgi:leader peptidase (prepilin peptidase)/N-methyltransferase